MHWYKSFKRYADNHLFLSYEFQKAACEFNLEHDKPPIQ